MEQDMKNKQLSDRAEAALSFVLAIVIGTSLAVALLHWWTT
jgi:hypothetical protein